MFIILVHCLVTKRMVTHVPSPYYPHTKYINSGMEMEVPILVISLPGVFLSHIIDAYLFLDDYSQARSACPKEDSESFTLWWCNYTDNIFLRKRNKCKIFQRSSGIIKDYEFFSESWQFE